MFNLPIKHQVTKDDLELTLFLEFILSLKLKVISTSLKNQQKTLTVHTELPKEIEEGTIELKFTNKQALISNTTPESTLQNHTIKIHPITRFIPETQIKAIRVASSILTISFALALLVSIMNSMSSIFNFVKVFIVFDSLIYMNADHPPMLGLCLST